MEVRRITNLPTHVFTIIDQFTGQGRREGNGIVDLDLDLGLGSPDPYTHGVGRVLFQTRHRSQGSNVTECWFRPRQRKTCAPHLYRERIGHMPYSLETRISSMPQAEVALVGAVRVAGTSDGISPDRMSAANPGYPWSQDRDRSTARFHWV
jgi:hypothetical protein